MAEETFTQSEIIAALGSFLKFGEMSHVPGNMPLHYGHRGYFSGPGFAARALRYHLEQLQAPPAVAQTLQDIEEFKPSRAHREGWDIFDVDSSGYLEIQRLDEVEIFDSDEEARTWVKNQAACDSDYHRDAIEQIRLNRLTHPTRPSAS